jgi:diaminohydroxyphosphoribosylaminopyrimidine deaminase/5-amino-6-(5-phosphoribosylamino)uracil reductase
VLDERDETYMRQALALAERGLGFVNPNPLVGCVLVRDGHVIGEGYHERYGELHAERNALADCRRRGVDPAGATAYVTLEPCCHHGKTPPCTEALIEARVARVVIASSDPNPLVAGKGLELLRSHGIEVDGPLLEAEALALNRPFFHFITTGMPFVVLKYAMTMDGKVATRTGASRWITGEEARLNVHRDRSRYAAIMVGRGTVDADDPMLTSRIEGGHNPIRVICDSTLSIGLDKQVVRTALEVPTIIATCNADPEAAAPYEAAGCEVLVVPGGPRVDMLALVRELGARKIDSIYVEGGPTLAWAALEAGIVNRVHTYIAPKLFGGADAPGPIRGLGVELPAECVRLVNTTMRQLGDDFLLESEVAPCSPE